MRAGDVVIHQIELSSGGPGHLSPAERERAARFHHETDRRRWTAARSALREILGSELGIDPADVPLVITATGKPALAAPYDRLHFNLSHCADLMLVALCAHGPVGIDVEPLARAADLAGCEETYLHPDEFAALPPPGPARNHRLLEIWTAKEALLKAAGCGLLHPPTSVAIAFSGPHPAWHADPPIPAISGWQLRPVAIPQHLAIVCLPLQACHECRCG